MAAPEARGEGSARSSTTPAIVASTAIRNVALHVPTVCPAPLKILDVPGKYVLGGLEALHSLTRQDPIDPGTTWGTQGYFRRLPGLRIRRAGGRQRAARLADLRCRLGPAVHAFRELAGEMAGNGPDGRLSPLSLFVRWQIWAGYLQLPLFFLWAPVVAVTMGQVRWSTVPRSVALLGLLLSFLWIYNNRLRPLSSLIDGSASARDQQYFSYIRWRPSYTRSTGPWQASLPGAAASGLGCESIRRP